MQLAYTSNNNIILGHRKRKWQRQRRHKSRDTLFEICKAVGNWKWRMRKKCKISLDFLLSFSCFFCFKNCQFTLFIDDFHSKDVPFKRRQEICLENVGEFGEFWTTRYGRDFTSVERISGWLSVAKVRAFLFQRWSIYSLYWWLSFYRCSFQKKAANWPQNVGKFGVFWTTRYVSEFHFSKHSLRKQTVEF